MGKAFKLATFNCNSVRSRMHIIGPWLSRHRPDALCLQETKAKTEDFPELLFSELGYNVACCGLGGHAGVAIVSPHKISKVSFGLLSEPHDEDRLVEAVVEGVTIVNTYVPQGREVEDEWFAYKLEWFKRLGRHFDEKYTPRKRLAWVGDFNVAPEQRDVYAPEKLLDHVDFHPEARAALGRLRNWGFVDVFRVHNDEAGQYSYYDYRAKDPIGKGTGWRVDHIYATKPLANKSTAAYIDLEPRRAEKPSDHTFVVAEFEL